MDRRTTGGILLLSVLITMPLAGEIFTPTSIFSLKAIVIMLFGLASIIIGMYLLDHEDE